MSDREHLCFLCGRRKDTKVDPVGSIGVGPIYNCAVCGWYSVSLEFAQDVELSNEIRAGLSAGSRQEYEKKTRRLFIITKQNYQGLVSLNRPSITEKLDKLLRLLAERCGAPGGAVRIDADLDYPLINASHPGEMNAYIGHLQTLGLIHRKSLVDGVLVGLEIPGWQRIEPTRKVGGDPDICFVAMSFASELNEAFELGIRLAIETDCGLKALRIDRKEHNNQITDEIMAGIRDAGFMVADFTGHRAGVYYEAGFARGLGREVICCCQMDDFDNRHFDLHVMNHIVWKDAGDLRVQLARRVKATILPKA